METLFRLDSDLLSAELTGQAASLLTEKFSTTGKVAKQKLIRFSRLQHWLPGESTNEEDQDDEEKAVVVLQNKTETIEPLLNEILEKNGQVDYYLDFLEDVYSSWQPEELQNLVHHDLLSLIKEATTVILKAHFEITLWKQYLRITNYNELYEEYKDVLSPSMLQIVLDISENSDHESLSIMTSTVSLMKEAFHEEASDFLANYGFCLTIHELFSLTFLLCFDTNQSESPAENYEGALEWLSKYHGCSVIAATLIVMAKKLIDGDTLVLCPNEQECLRQMFIHIYPQYGDKIEALDTLGFHLILSNGSFKSLDFCKDSQFWSGYQRLIAFYFL